MGVVRSQDHTSAKTICDLVIVPRAPSASKDEQKAAVFVRARYSHALEAFIALVGATIQAPDCVQQVRDVRS